MTTFVTRFLKVMLCIFVQLNFKTAIAEDLSSFLSNKEIQQRIEVAKFIMARRTNAITIMSECADFLQYANPNLATIFSSWFDRNKSEISSILTWAMALSKKELDAPDDVWRKMLEGKILQPSSDINTQMLREIFKQKIPNRET